MKKLLLFFVLGLSVVSGSNAMKRPSFQSSDEPAAKRRCCDDQLQGAEQAQDHDQNQVTQGFSGAFPVLAPSRSNNQSDWFNLRDQVSQSNDSSDSEEDLPQDNDFDELLISGDIVIQHPAQQIDEKRQRDEEDTYIRLESFVEGNHENAVKNLLEDCNHFALLKSKDLAGLLIGAESQEIQNHLNKAFKNKFKEDVKNNDIDVVKAILSNAKFLILLTIQDLEILYKEATCQDIQYLLAKAIRYKVEDDLQKTQIN